MARPYLIWSMLHNAWWRPKAAGYTESIADAGVFDKPEAQTFDSARERAVYLPEARAQIVAAEGIYIKRLAQLRAVESKLGLPA